MSVESKRSNDFARHSWKFSVSPISNSGGHCPREAFVIGDVCPGNLSGGSHLCGGSVCPTVDQPSSYHRAVSTEHHLYTVNNLRTNTVNVGIFYWRIIMNKNNRIKSVDKGRCQLTKVLSKCENNFTHWYNLNVIKLCLAVVMKQIRSKNCMCLCFR